MFSIVKFTALRLIQSEKCLLQTLNKKLIVRQTSKKSPAVLQEDSTITTDSSELYSGTVDDEEEIELKRNKNRLPPRVYKLFVKKESDTPYVKNDFTRNRLRIFYGRYGKDTGLRPGVMWPNKEELDDILEYERMFRPPLKDTLAKIAAEKAEIQKQRQEYEEVVTCNLSKHDELVKEYYDKIAKKQLAAEQLKSKREALVEEISEYLGYDVDPADPKFKDAIDQKEKEKKKKLKEKKQQDSYNKMLQKLAEIAEKKPEDM